MLGRWRTSGALGPNTSVRATSVATDNNVKCSLSHTFTHTHNFTLTCTWIQIKQKTNRRLYQGLCPIWRTMCAIFIVLSNVVKCQLFFFRVSGFRAAKANSVSHMALFVWTQLHNCFGQVISLSLSLSQPASFPHMKFDQDSKLYPLDPSRIEVVPAVSHFCILLPVLRKKDSRNSAFPISVFWMPQPAHKQACCDSALVARINLLPIVWPEYFELLLIPYAVCMNSSDDQNQ